MNGLGPAEGLGDPLPVLPAGDARSLGRRVDRHDPPGAVPDQVHDGVGELALSPVGVELPEEQRFGAGGQLLRTPGLVEEDDLQRPGRVVDLELDQGSSAPGSAGTRADFTSARTTDSSPTFMPGHLGLPGPVDVAARVVHQEVGDRLDADRRESLGPLVADPLDPVDRDVRELGEGPAPFVSRVVGRVRLGGRFVW